MPKNTLTEQQIVNYIQEFFHAQAREKTSVGVVPDRIEQFIKDKNITNKDDRDKLRSALMVQHNASFYAMKQKAPGITHHYHYSSSTVDYILFPGWPYYGGYGWGIIRIVVVAVKLMVKQELLFWRLWPSPLL